VFSAAQPGQEVISFKRGKNEMHKIPGMNANSRHLLECILDCMDLCVHTYQSNLTVKLSYW